MVLSLQWSTESIDAEPWPYDICESGNRSAQAVRLLMCARNLEMHWDHPQMRIGSEIRAMMMVMLKTSIDLAEPMHEGRSWYRLLVLGEE